MRKTSKYDRGNKKVVQAKEDASFFEWCRKIARFRFGEGLDKYYSPQRVQRKLLKHPQLKRIEDDLKIAKFLDDERGQMGDPFMIFRFVVVAFLAVVMFGGMIYVMGLLNTTFIDIGHQNENSVTGVNFTQAAQQTFGQVNQSIQALRLVAICLIFAEVLLVFVFASFKRVHPAMFIVWVFIVFFAVMLAAPISNSYESLLQQGVYGGLLESFTGSNWILLNLPWIVLLVGIGGGIFMFINIVRSGGEEDIIS